MNVNTGIWALIGLIAGFILNRLYHLFIPK